MTKEVAIIICNYNKRDYLLQCIESVFKLSFSYYDLYVVDNASTDGSVEVIKKVFGKRVILLKNKVNKGGSGGFNTGIKVALSKEYQYLYLLDNDVIVDENALLQLYNYLQTNKDVGIVGSLIYSLDKPSEIQEMGAEIDWENFYIKPKFKGNQDNPEIPKEFECDYVPACSLLVRSEAIQKAGLMDEGNFIYWDDIEWGYRIKKHGYRVVALSSSKVWHKMGVAQRTNTFGTYYFWRNRFNFFLRNMPDDNTSRFATKIFSELFQALYSCNFNQKYHSARTILFAVEDALTGIRGKAPEGRIADADSAPRKLEELLDGKTEILIADFENLKTVRDVVNRVRQIRPEIKVVLGAESHSLQLLAEQFPDIRVAPWNAKEINQYSPVLRVCRHIMELGSTAAPGMYIDQFLNVVSSQADLDYVRNFNQAFKAAEAMFYPVFLDRVIVFRKNIL